MLEYLNLSNNEQELASREMNLFSNVFLTSRGFRLMVWYWP